MTAARRSEEARARYLHDRVPLALDEFDHLVSMHGCTPREACETVLLGLVRDALSGRRYAGVEPDRATPE